MRVQYFSSQHPCCCPLACSGRPGRTYDILSNQPRSAAQKDSLVGYGSATWKRSSADIGGDLVDHVDANGRIFFKTVTDNIPGPSAVPPSALISAVCHPGHLPCHLPLAALMRAPCTPALCAPSPHRIGLTHERSCGPGYDKWLANIKLKEQRAAELKAKQAQGLVDAAGTPIRIAAR